MPVRRAEWNGPILCEPPTGLAEWKGADWRKGKLCPNRATCYLNFTTSRAGGGWYLCDACCVIVVMWLEEGSLGEAPEFEREVIK